MDTAAGVVGILIALVVIVLAISVMSCTVFCVLGMVIGLPAILFSLLSIGLCLIIFVEYLLLAALTPPTVITLSIIACIRIAKGIKQRKAPPLPEET